VGARRWLSVLTLALLGSEAVACVAPPPYRQPPDFDRRFEAVRTITLVPPKVAVYEMSAGDMEEEVQAWSDSAQEHVAAAVRAEVAELGRTFVPYVGVGPHVDHRAGSHGGAGRRPSNRKNGVAEDSWLLFEAANIAIMRHTYDPAQTFPTRMSDFGYTLGPGAAALLGGTVADAFLLIIATDHIASRERQALVAAGLAMGLMKGAYAGPSATPAKLTLALVEARTGDIIWFNQLSMPFSDLRDEATDKVLVDMVMKGLAQ
jgi:hypothetical protein